MEAIHPAMRLTRTFQPLRWRECDQRANVLKLVIDRLKDRTLPEQTLVHERHQLLFQVAFACGDQLQPALVHLLKPFLTDVASVAKQLSEQVLRHFRHGAIVSVRSSQLECQQFTVCVDHQMQLAAKLPSGRAFPPPHLLLEHLVSLSASGVTDLNRGRIDQGNPAHVALAGIEPAAQQHQAPGHQLHEA